MNVMMIIYYTVSNKYIWGDFGSTGIEIYLFFMLKFDLNFTFRCAQLNRIFFAILQLNSWYISLIIKIHVKPLIGTEYITLAIVNSLALNWNKIANWKDMEEYI